MVQQGGDSGEGVNVGPVCLVAAAQWGSAGREGAGTGPVHSSVAPLDWLVGREGCRVRLLSCNTVGCGWRKERGRGSKGRQTELDER